MDPTPVREPLEIVVNDVLPAPCLRNGTPSPCTVQGMHKCKLERSLRPGCNQSESMSLSCDQKLCKAAGEPRRRSRNWSGCEFHIQCTRSLGSMTSTGCISSAGSGLALSFRSGTLTTYVCGVASALKARFKVRLLLEDDPFCKNKT